MIKFGLPTIIDSDNNLPKRIVGYISVQGPESVFAVPTKPLNASSKAYHADERDMESVRNELVQLGFRIIAQTALGLSVEAGPGQFAELTGGKIQTKERLTRIGNGVHRYVTCLDIVGENQPPTLGVGRVASPALKVDGIVLESPKPLHSVFPSPIPPNSPKYYLRVPNDIATIFAASQVHQQGIRGDGVTVAMPDTGWYRHPYFTANGYNVRTPLVVSDGADPSRDPIGHGTGESANLLAIAPGVILQPIRATDSEGNFVGTLAAFNRAKTLIPQPNIITCSWGSDYLYPPPFGPDQDALAIAAEIRDALERGILVIFSTGDGQFAIEPQIPGVIAAGGVYIDSQGQMQASDFASGYKSPWFDGVVVPTVCGLSGMQPRAQYLMLPVPPGSQYDQLQSGPSQGEDGDGTPPDDGWALFSGTSAAAPQVAGVAALLLCAKPGLTRDQVVEALTKTAVDVLVGHSYPQVFNEPAGPGLDNATGYGLINAAAAIDYVKHF
jgi:subtilisin family serine protease